jgi:hypothetical protein
MIQFVAVIKPATTKAIEALLFLTEKAETAGVKFVIAPFKPNRFINHNKLILYKFVGYFNLFTSITNIKYNNLPQKNHQKKPPRINPQVTKKNKKNSKIIQISIIIIKRKYKKIKNGTSKIRRKI